MRDLAGRQLLARRELPVILALLLAAGGLLLWARLAPSGSAAVVEVDGREVLRRELNRLAGPEEHAVTGAGGLRVTVELSPRGARVADSGCPDKTCVRAGILTQAGQSAVCLPGRVVLRLEGAGAADAETY